jgi:hypothetical protein
MWSDAVMVHPWVGDFYTTPLHFKCRTLIVGDSGNATLERFKPELVIESVRDDMSGNDNRDTTGFCRFSTKLRRTLMGRHRSICPSEFWDSLAYYYVGHPLTGDCTRARQIDEMWAESIPAFVEVVASLAPVKLLVLGSSNWQNLLKRIPHRKTGPYSAEIDIACQTIRAGFINHPSSGLLYSRWRPVAEAFLFG